MKHLLSILLLLSVIAGTAAAKGIPPGDNNEDHGNPKAATAKPTPRVEELLWILPTAVSHEAPQTRLDQQEFEQAVVELYKWYLQTNKNGANMQTLGACGKELMFHFKVDPKILQQYFQFIKNNFPGLSEEDLINGKKNTAANNRRKFAPVSTRDDIESPMSFSLTK